MIQDLNVKELREKYMSALPFPHIVIENAFEPEKVRRLVEEFPHVEAPKDVKYRGAHEHKDVTCDRKKLGPDTNAFIDYLNSDAFVSWLQAVTGIEEKLVADHKLMGGGLHESPRGGYLMLHADFNKHYETGYDRRVNLLLYLNEDWPEEYGGHIELWDKEMTECKVKVLPTFNTMVIFNTTDYSFHGHPDPNKCPEGRKRMGLNMYYYSNGRPQHELNPIPHNSIWVARPNSDDPEGCIT